MTASLETEIQFEISPSQTRVPAADRARILEAPGFGQVFTDHMITLRWTAERGWHDGKLEPYGPFSLDPATAVFHYGQELFEGLKAYRQSSGSIVMFRPTTYPFSLRPSRNAAASRWKGSGDALWRNPTTGIAGCCARPAKGHAVAAPPSSVMTARRFILSPRRRARAPRREFRGQAPSQS